jgi:ureidoacrylate peracid hydrolase
MIDFSKLDKVALMLIDLQNDFLHPDGAYARGKATSASITDLPSRLKPVADCVRARGGWIVSTHFTLVPGRGGEPLISPHLAALRPFLRKGDFAPGGFGHALVDALQPADFSVEKVAFSAFYMSRLEWILRKAGVETLVFSGIVTNGGVASTLRDAHVRDFTTVLLEDGCAAFSDDTHRTNVAALQSVAEVMSCAEFIAAFQAGR